MSKGFALCNPAQGTKSLGNPFAAARFTGGGLLLSWGLPFPQRHAIISFAHFVERYRSGHNGADSKSVCRKRHVGSNPTRSATSQSLETLVFQGFFLCSKAWLYHNVYHNQHFSATLSHGRICWPWQICPNALKLQRKKTTMEKNVKVRDASNSLTGIWIYPIIFMFGKFCSFYRF